MTKDEALRLALEYVELVPDDRYNAEHIDQDALITAIKAALEAKDEPVAWMYPDDLKRFETSEAYAEAYSIEMVSPTQGETIPLYTTPPQRKPLTDEEIQQIFIANSVVVDNGNAYMVAGLRTVNIARAIEAAHGIKGEK